MKLRLTKAMQDVQWAFISLAISSLVHFLLRVVLGRELGASGLGLYTLVFTIYMFGMQFAAFGIGAALTKYVAEHNENGKKNKRICIIRIDRLIFKWLNNGRSCVFIL